MYRWIDHTGELELEIQAPDEETVFSDAVAAMRELLDDGTRDRDVSHDLDVKTTDRADGLKEFLEDLLFLVETKDFVPDSLSKLELGENALHATVAGYRGRPPHLVKAVTYHRLDFDRSDSGWKATVVFDV